MVRTRTSGWVISAWLPGLLLIAGCGARNELDVSSRAGATGPVKVDSIALGWNHGCAVLSDGTAACWGLDASGQLGDAPTTAPRLTAAPLVGLAGIASMSGGYEQGCAVLRDGTLECWGDGGLGEVGDGTSSKYTPPTVVGSGAKSVSAGFLYTCAVLEGDVAECWGVGDHGQIGGMAYSGFHQTTPTPVPGAAPATAIAANQYRSCTILAAGEVECWGLSPLGDNATGDSAWPIQAVKVAFDASPPKQLAVGSNHTCALREDGTVLCWGYGGYGELGLGTSVVDALLPTTVPGASPAKAISAGENHTCAVLEGGTVTCWGDISDGGKGTFVPVPVPGLSGAVAVASGQSFDCALLESGRVVCWGAGNTGQLGNGATADSTTPVEVVGLP